MQEHQKKLDPISLDQILEEKDLENDNRIDSLSKRPNKSISSKQFMKTRTIIDEMGSMERKSTVPKLKFGELHPESVPIFGYPFVNYSPTNQQNEKGVDNGKQCSDKLWQVFSGAIVYHAHKADNDKEKMLLD